MIPSQLNIVLKGSCDSCYRHMVYTYIFFPCVSNTRCIDACLDRVASISQKLHVSERGLGKRLVVNDGRLRFADTRFTEAH